MPISQNSDGFKHECESVSSATELPEVGAAVVAVSTITNLAGELGDTATDHGAVIDIAAAGASRLGAAIARFVALQGC